MYRFTVLPILLLLVVVCGAQAASTAGISVPAAGDHYYWFSYTDVNGKPATTAPTAFKDKSTTADLPLVKDVVPKSTLYVLDASTGNEALRPIPAKAANLKKLTFKAADFDRVRRLVIEVVSSPKGQPVASGIVKLTEPEGAASVRMLDPSSRGRAEFTDVSTGTVKISVEYGDGKSTSQDIDIDSERKEAVPLIKVPVVGNVETVSPAASESTDGGKPAPGARVDYKTVALGLALFFIIMYGAYRLFASRGATARKMFKKVGIDLPESEQAVAGAGATAPAPVDPTVCPFCGGKKDPVTGQCACSTSSGTPASGVGAAQGPRLVAVQGPGAGSIYPLQADGSSIGREESNAIPLSMDNTASRRHALVSLTNGEWMVRDEGSSNGTFVNGAKITEQVLHPGDEIQVGSTRFRFEL